VDPDWYIWISNHGAVNLLQL